jgi:hypothetical protein
VVYSYSDVEHGSSEEVDIHDGVGLDGVGLDGVGLDGDSSHELVSELDELDELDELEDEHEELEELFKNRSKSISHNIPSDINSRITHAIFCDSKIPPHGKP